MSASDKSSSDPSQIFAFAGSLMAGSLMAVKLVILVSMLV